jgi:RecA/RadA recombinase
MPDPEERIRRLEEHNKHLRERLAEEQRTSEACRDEAVRWQGVAEGEHRSRLRAKEEHEMFRRSAMAAISENGTMVIHQENQALYARVHAMQTGADRRSTLTRRAVEEMAAARQEKRDLEAVVEQLKEKVTKVERQRDDVEATARKTIEGLTKKIDRIADQTRLWNRGELDAMTAVAGIAAEMNGYPLPEPGAWERAKAQRAAEILSQHREMSEQLGTIQDLLEEAGFAAIVGPVKQVRYALRYYGQQLDRSAENSEGGDG